MIVLDTNVISELMRVHPNTNVIDWLSGYRPEEVAITAITQAEILFGLAIMVDGQRKAGLIEAANALFAEDFAGRVLPFDSAAATHFADIAATRRRLGRPISQADAQITAIVRSTQALLATRNVSDFVDCGMDVVNPFD